MPELSPLLARLPTPLAVGLSACLTATNDPLGKRVADLYETWRRFTFVLSLGVYLRGEKPHRAFNDLLFPVAESRHLPSAVISGLLHALTVHDALATPLGAAIRELLAHAFGRTGGTDLVTALDRHAVYVHHRLSSSAEDEHRFRQLTELLTATAALFACGSIRGVANGASWEFRGCEPQQVEQPSTADAAVWLQWQDGTTCPLADGFTVANSTPPALAVIDQLQLARNLSRWVAASPPLSAPYAHYQAQLRGVFDFPPLEATPAPAGFSIPLAEFARNWSAGRPVLILRHLGGEVAAQWLRAALEASGATAFWYPLGHSPVAAQSEAFRAWLWRQLHRAAGGNPSDNPPERTAQLEARIRELAAQLRAKSQHVLIVDHLEKVITARSELPAELGKVQGLGLDVLVLSEPVRLDFATGWQSFYWPAGYFPRAGRAAIEARVAELAPPGSLHRRLLEWVAAAEHPVTLRTLAVALKTPSPNVFGTALQLAPLFACPRGPRDLTEGYEQLQFFDPLVREVVRLTATDVLPLAAVETALTQADAARNLFEARTAPPSHEPNEPTHNRTG